MSKRTKKQIQINEGYDWKKGLEKFSIDASIVIITGIITVYQDEPSFLAIIPLAKVILNWLKHRK